MKIIRIFPVFLGLVLAIACFGQPTKSLPVVDFAPVIDGRINEEFYSTITPVTTQFYNYKPNNGRKAPDSIVVFLYTYNHRLFLAAKVYETIQPKKLIQRDFDDDPSSLVGISLAETKNIVRAYYLSPQGIQSDLQVLNGKPDQNSASYDAIWKSGTFLNQDNYSVEIEVPCTFRTDTIQYLLFRVNKALNSYSSYPWVSESANFFTADFFGSSICETLAPDKLIMSPYFEVDKNFHTVMGGEAKLRIGDNSALSFFVKPDFSSAIDKVQISYDGIPQKIENRYIFTDSDIGLKGYGGRLKVFDSKTVGLTGLDYGMQYRDAKKTAMYLKEKNNVSAIVAVDKGKFNFFSMVSSQHLPYGALSFRAFSKIQDKKTKTFTGLILNESRNWAGSFSFTDSGEHNFFSFTSIMSKINANGLQNSYVPHPNYIDNEMEIRRIKEIDENKIYHQLVISQRNGITKDHPYKYSIVSSYKKSFKGGKILQYGITGSLQKFDEFEVFLKGMEVNQLSLFTRYASPPQRTTSIKLETELGSKLGGLFASLTCEIQMTSKRLSFHPTVRFDRTILGSYFLASQSFAYAFNQRLEAVLEGEQYLSPASKSSFNLVAALNYKINGLSHFRFQVKKANDKTEANATFLYTFRK